MSGYTPDIGRSEFSKIRLRTKIKSSVVDVELARREIVFSDFEKIIYVKDMNDELLTFLPSDNSIYTDYNTLSASKILELTSGSSGNFDILDGGIW